MFDKHLRSTVEPTFRQIGAKLNKAGIKADHLTIAGLVIAAGAGVTVALGWLQVGLLLLVVAGVADLLDGAVAKASGTASPRGAFFDSVVDRVSDAFLLFGVAYYLGSGNNGSLIIMLPMAVLAGGIIISYERSKAEALGYEAKGGIMERAERLIALGFGLLFPVLLIPVLWIMLVLVWFTVVQRFWHVWTQASQPRPAKTARRTRRISRRPTRRDTASRWRTRRPTGSPGESRSTGSSSDTRSTGSPSTDKSS